MSEKKMQHCFWCGAEIGVYEKHWREVDTCGAQECDREARNAQAAEHEEAQERAREDNFDRYR